MNCKGVCFLCSSFNSCSQSGGLCGRGREVGPGPQPVSLLPPHAVLQHAQRERSEFTQSLRFRVCSTEMCLSPPSGDASSGQEEASEVEDELGDSQRGPTHHRQVPLQDHQK